MKEVSNQFYAIFEISIPSTLNRRTRKKIVYETIMSLIPGNQGEELPEEFTTWVDKQTILFEKEYVNETVELLEADIVENIHSLKAIIFQEGILPGDIIRRTGDFGEEE